MIFDRDKRQSRENSAVKYNPFKGKRRKISLGGKSDYNILNLKTDKEEKKKNKGIFEQRRLNSAKRRGKNRKRGNGSKGSSRRDSERKVSKSRDTKRALMKGSSGTIGGSEFFSSISKYQTNGFLGFNRKPSLDVQKLAEEKAQQNVFGRKSSMANVTGKLLFNLKEGRVRGLAILLES